MRVEQLKEAKEEAPFKSFTIFLSDQRRFEIRHPDFLWIMPGGRTVGIADDNGIAHIIDLVHVTGISLQGQEHP